MEHKIQDHRSRPKSQKAFCLPCFILYHVIFGDISCSGVTLLKGARGQGMAGCPIDYEALAQSAKNRSAQRPQALGSRGPLKGPGGVQGQSPWWGSRGRSPWWGSTFQCEYSISNANLYMGKLGNGEHLSLEAYKYPKKKK